MKECNNEQSRSIRGDKMNTTDSKKPIELIEFGDTYIYVNTQ